MEYDKEKSQQVIQRQTPRVRFFERMAMEEKVTVRSVLVLVHLKKIH